VLVMEFVQVFKLGFQVGVVKSRCAGRVVVDFLISILDGLSLPTTCGSTVVWFTS
jgi:hypothetical protein